MYVLLLPIMTTRKFYTHFQAWNSLKQYSETKAEIVEKLYDRYLSAFNTFQCWTIKR